MNHEKIILKFLS